MIIKLSLPFKVSNNVYIPIGITHSPDEAESESSKADQKQEGDQK